MTAFVSAAQLCEELAAGQTPCVLDVRWTLTDPDGRPAYLGGHLPGAVYVDLETDLSDHGKAGIGRHPLPDADAFHRAARGWGLRDGQSVVVYDDEAGIVAARAWWLLRHAGVDNVRILDGALAGWVAAGGDVATGPFEPTPGDAMLSWGHLVVVDLDQAAAFPQTGVLLDARAPERYRGESEPMDPRAGHIPGAVSAPTAANVGADGRFLSPDLLRERFAAICVDGTRPVAVYCGSGISAAHQIAALETVGIEAALFPGSWSQWSNDHTRPVAVGEA